jgi:putative toxin-antitoxin system antitoxin component (TIGR02293 family)
MKAEEFKYADTETGDVYQLIDRSRKGISFLEFKEFSSAFALSSADWSKLLHISERTLQRYRKEKKKFDPVHSEKILQLILLFNKGEELFGDRNAFIHWLKSPVVSLGKVNPITLLDNSFGVELVKDELSRIEHGVLA